MTTWNVVYSYAPDDEELIDEYETEEEATDRFYDLTKNVGVYYAVLQEVTIDEDENESVEELETYESDCE